MVIIDVRMHISKGRAPDTIKDTVSHYIGEAHGTQVRTVNWGQLRAWFLNNKNREGLRVVAVCEEEPISEGA